MQLHIETYEFRCTLDHLDIEPHEVRGVFGRIMEGQSHLNQWIDRQIALGRKLLDEKDPKEAKRTGQVDGMPNDPITLIKDGRIHYRDIPKQQSLEDWNEFWQEYKNAS